MIIQGNKNAESRHDLWNPTQAPDLYLCASTLKVLDGVFPYIKLIIQVATRYLKDISHHPTLLFPAFQGARRLFS